MVSRKNIVVSKDSIGIDKDLTKDQNLNTFKMYCKWRKSSARFPYRKTRNRLYACHCIAGNDNVNFAIKWSIHKKSRAYNNAAKRCNLCLAEKLAMALADKGKSLNRRTELVSKCSHDNKI